MLCRRFLISGRVQGVRFRASTAEVAQALDLCGHAINLPDGRVEVIARGDVHALARLEDWLQYGPRFARVESVVADEVEVAPGAYIGFVTG